MQTMVFCVQSFVKCEINRYKIHNASFQILITRGAYHLAKKYGNFGLRSNGKAIGMISVQVPTSLCMQNKLIIHSRYCFVEQYVYP